LTSALKIQENILLAPYTTLQVGGPARYFMVAASESDLREAVDFAAGKRLPLFVLGGGSNLLVSDAGWPGVVVHISLRGIEFGYENDFMLFYAAAGESWDSFVAQTVEQRCAGLECLSGIPGTVGGTPVQNVGAYGQEVSRTIHRVRVLELSSGRVMELSNSDCGFQYRRSIFNTSAAAKYVVVEVGFRLKKGGAPTLDYADVKNFFASATTRPSLSQVREAVRQIRAGKAMLITPGDEDSRSAGSFFKNPLVTEADAQRIELLAQQLVPGKTMPRYNGEGGLVKLSAAWLVEQSGFHKGYQHGSVAISRKHSLAIVNRGGATARDIIALKDQIQAKVFDKWGVRLSPEPVFVGFAGSLPPAAPY
jgi:UDP-N-acetylmuramate dehydrogenase